MAVQVLRRRHVAPRTGEATTHRDSDALNEIRAALRGLQFGKVTAVVTDGVVVRVERTEKFRIDHTTTHQLAEDRTTGSAPPFGRSME